MNIYTCTQFTGHYPVGSAAVVIAENPIRATELLNEELRSLGLSGDAFSFHMDLLSPTTAIDPLVRILSDGNY